jgi:hypothetical protein
VLHYKYKKMDSDANQQQRSLELLFSMLFACHPTEEDQRKFLAFGLKDSILRTAVEMPMTCDAVSKVLTIFTGKC